MSYYDLTGLSLDNPEPIPAKPGDLVLVGSSRTPIWRVIAVNGPTAWIGRTEPGLEHVEGLTPISRLRAAPDTGARA